MYYFKTKRIVKRVRKKESHVEEWRYTGIVSPYDSDYMIMSTLKPLEAIHHTEKELPIIKRRLNDRKMRWRLYRADTNECINVVQDINGQITELND